MRNLLFGICLGCLFGVPVSAVEVPENTDVIVYQSPVLLGRIDGRITITRPQDMILTRHTAINGQLLLPGDPVIEYDPEKNTIAVERAEGAKESNLTYLVQIRHDAVVDSILSGITPPEREAPRELEPDFHFRRLTLKNGKVMREARQRGLTPPSQPGGRYVWETLEPGDHPGIRVRENGNAILKATPDGPNPVFMIDGLEIESGQQLTTALPSTLIIRDFAAIRGKLGQPSDPHAITVIGARSDIVLAQGGILWSKETHLPRGAILVGDSSMICGRRILTDHLILTPGSRVLCHE